MEDLWLSLCTFVSQIKISHTHTHIDMFLKPEEKETEVTSGIQVHGHVGGHGPGYTAIKVSYLSFRNFRILRTSKGWWCGIEGKVTG